MLLSDLITAPESIEDVEQQIGVFKKFLNTLPDKALSLGIRIGFAILFLIIGLWVIKVLRKIVRKSMEKAGADLGVRQFVDSFMKVALTLLLLLMIAGSFGLDAASVVALVGSMGVALGLALQGSLSNFAGGVLILLLKPFRVGDYIIEDSKGNEGTVTEIQMFYTKLLTPDGKTVILPNGTLANTSMVNLTSANLRRLDVIVGISYDSNIKKAREIILEIMDNIPEIFDDKDKVVAVDELAESSVNLTVKCHVLPEQYWSVRGRLLESIKESFDEQGIMIPYPQLDIHTKD